MRNLLVLISILGAFLSASVTTARASSGEDKALTIEVSEGNWGNANTADIEALLYSVASELRRFIETRPPAEIVVIPSEKAPAALYQKGRNGEYVILLSAKNRRWAQYAYQFSHELCHVFSNYERGEVNNGVKPNQWFEEAVCEAAAVFTLRRMASTWGSNPPYSDWADYAAVLRAYAEQLTTQSHRRLPGDIAFGTWYAANRDAVSGNPYLRQKNEVCANLLLSLFESTPEHWAAIGYLNLHRSSAEAGFLEYLESWRQAAPARHRVFITEVIALFDLPEHRETMQTVLAR